jgi:hypothetical protein
MKSKPVASHPFNLRADQLQRQFEEVEALIERAQHRVQYLYQVVAHLDSSGGGTYLCRDSHVPSAEQNGMVALCTDKRRPTASADYEINSLALAHAFSFNK